MHTLTVSISPHQANRVQQAVAAGDYASDGDVLREALRLWEQREDVRRQEIERLRQAYAEGLASGPGREVTADTLLAQFKAKALIDG